MPVQCLRGRGVQHADANRFKELVAKHTEPDSITHRVQYVGELPTPRELAEMREARRHPPANGCCQLVLCCRS